MWNWAKNAFYCITARDTNKDVPDVDCSVESVGENSSPDDSSPDDSFDISRISEIPSTDNSLFEPSVEHLESMKKDLSDVEHTPRDLFMYWWGYECGLEKNRSCFHELELRCAEEYAKYVEAAEKEMKVIQSVKTSQACNAKELEDREAILCQKQQALEEEREEREARIVALEAYSCRLEHRINELVKNIRVFLRVRPVEEKTLPFSILSHNTIRLSTPDCTTQYTFDQVIPPSSSPSSFFSHVSPILQSCFEGIPISIMAYGPSGSGKTHTILGSAGVSDGLIQQSIRYLIKQAASNQYTISIQFSAFEIYNDSVKDLLCPSSICRIIEQGAHFVVSPLQRYALTSIDDLYRDLATASANRQQAFTSMNDHSSRSHMFVDFHVSIAKDGISICTNALLRFVDLGGNERIRKSEVQGSRLKETCAINSNLSALTSVFKALQKKSSFIPYRNSKLTMLLKQSLNPNSKVLFISHIHPDSMNERECCQTLDFSSSLANIIVG